MIESITPCCNTGPTIDINVYSNSVGPTAKTIALDMTASRETSSQRV